MDNSPGTGSGHAPVLLAEAVAALAAAPDEVMVDATFGGGGYSRALLAGAAGRVIGVDRDPEAVARGRALEQVSGRFAMIEGRFGELPDLLAGIGVAQVDGIVADLGLSSFQLDAPARGFAFSRPGPLDMRMGGEGATAAELLASLDTEAIARILRDYGEEPHARRIARAIIAARGTPAVATTDGLRTLVAACKPRTGARIDPATLVFQALRIAVNDELGELERLLAAAPTLLRPGGRLVLVTFHSGEDRIVKRFVDGAGGRPIGRSRHLPPLAEPPRMFAWATRGVVRPGPAETLRNPRARSAKLRAAVRLAEDAAREEDPAGTGWRRAA